jgi:hypothetical protein
MRTFANYTCNVYQFSTQIVDGSKIQGKTLIYSAIPCGFWRAKEQFGWPTATQSSGNAYEINLEPEYLVSIQDIIEVDSIQYVVTDVIQHHTHKGILDNLQILVTRTTND